MAKKEYLNEEEYQKNNKKVKIAGTIIIAIGLCIICAAVYTLISASKMNVPSSMWDPDWFEYSTAQMEKESTGMFMLIPGIFVTVVGCMVRFVVANQRSIMAYQAQQAMPIAQEGIEKMAPTAGKAAKEIAKGIKEGTSGEETMYCKHCGTKIDADSRFCSKCGKEQ